MRMEKTDSYKEKNSSKGRAMVEAFRRRPVIAESRVRYQVTPCEICAGQSGTVKSFLS